VSDIIVREFRENAEFGLFRQSRNVSVIDEYLAF